MKCRMNSMWVGGMGRGRVGEWFIDEQSIDDRGIEWLIDDRLIDEQLIEYIEEWVDVMGGELVNFAALVIDKLVGPPTVLTPVAPIIVNTQRIRSE